MVDLSFLIITGLSGAGKTLALNTLEDSGYYCVDNLPSELLPAFIKQCENATPKINRAAIAIDGREMAFGFSGEQLLSLLDKQEIPLQLLFLDCREDVLCRRFSETRRRHPFEENGDIRSGIARERALLGLLRERANFVLDTSDLTPRMFTARLVELLGAGSHGKMSVLLTSFGFKRGLPIDADIVLDMRFLPNPFYISELRPFSGLEKPVIDYIENDPQAAPFIEATLEMLKIALPGYKRQNKRRVMIAFGCTGGRHRSVYAAQRMMMLLQNENFGYELQIAHRDLKVEQDTISERFSHTDKAGE